jgi:hypothetical protein
MNQIATDPADRVTPAAPVLRMLGYLRERLDNLTADMITLMQAIDRDDFNAIDELEAGIRRVDGYPVLDAGGALTDAISAEEVPVTAPA